MMHPARERWERFAAGALQGGECIELEHHLARCEACLHAYMEAVEGMAALEADRADHLTDTVMWAVAAMAEEASRSETNGMAEAGARSGLSGPDNARAANDAQSGKARDGRRGRIAWDAGRKRALVHYAIAVCVMLLMMSAGVFDRLAAQPEQWKAERQQEQGGSLSDALMAKTSLVIDKVLDSERP
ncbi:zf-HC2 domain-containing protein [Paenibacillus methanolicus]|uniref:Putative zinc-finger n=1 Tax=Paenibacillus methanolicus TaxID=582686 RepID=A0A5S5CCI7_9BACL|nr:zf-HC2 domain-containing protein [Paenibacillus methanolicus]TYP75713.1 putative zinc-finger [Paenibacillus methanolicus]